MTNVKRQKCWWLMGLAILAIAEARPLLSENGMDRQIDNVRAFARLYGYVRFFHPSDEAAAIDWNAFAVYGAGEALNAKNPKELKAVLDRIFTPPAPAVLVCREGETPPPLVLPGRKENPAPGDVLAWQHQGIMLENIASVYKSVRLNRVNKVSKHYPNEAGIVMRVVDAVPYRGKTIRLSVYMKTLPEFPGCRAHLWLRVDRPQNQIGFFDNMMKNPVTASEWQKRTIECPVAEDAASVNFGYFLTGGAGQALADNFLLEVREADETWKTIPLENMDGETGALAQAPPAWRFNGREMTFKTVLAGNETAGSASGHALSIEAGALLIEPPLFPQYPLPGETWDRPLGSGLRCRVPLALFNLPEAPPSPAMLALRKELENIRPSDLPVSDVRVRLAGVIIVWNVFQHFYPYFDVVKTDWEQALTNSLKRALQDQTHDDYIKTLRLLSAQAHDGHASVWHVDEQYKKYLPLLCRRVRGERLMVSASLNREILRGDEILEIDGVPVRKTLTDLEAESSGSPQYKRVTADSRVGMASADNATLKLKRGDQQLSVAAPRATWMERRNLKEFDRPPLAEIKKGVWFVDLNTVPMGDINVKLKELAEARGIIFDLRQYPNRNHDVLTHLLDKPDTSKEWMKTTRRIYPDREKPAGEVAAGWEMQPAEPRFKGKAIFLISPRAISYAESMLGLVEGYQLADRVGQPTAGTNGNNIQILLPGGYSCGFTGMKVVKHDGSQHHLIGVLPTHPVEWTAEDVIAGKDADLEEALRILGD